MTVAELNVDGVRKAHSSRSLSVFRRVVDLEPVPQPAAHLLTEPLHQGLAGARTQIIQNQMDGVGGRIVFRNLQQILGKLGRGNLPASREACPNVQY